jgi:hypothetical protein
MNPDQATAIRLSDDTGWPRLCGRYRSQSSAGARVNASE